MTQDERELVRRALKEVQDIQSDYKAASKLGVSEPTIRRWRKGEIAIPLRKGPREALNRYFGITNNGRSVAESRPDYGDDRVEQLLRLFPGDEMLRRLSQHVGPRDLHRMAYDLAVRLGYSERDLSQIHEWGLQVMRDEKNGS